MACEISLMLVFLSSAVLRSAYSKIELVEARLLNEDGEPSFTHKTM